LTFRPVAIFPTSETVTHRARELLERVFSTRVYDQYASSEGAPFITECSENSLHIELSSGVFENFSDSHEILVTSFHTHGTPLIRYRIGDSISLNRDGRCSCGLSSPLAASIQGRSDDFLIRGDGAKVNGGHVANLFKNMPNSIVQAQVVQKKIGILDVYLVVDINMYYERFCDLFV